MSNSSQSKGVVKRLCAAALLSSVILGSANMAGAAKGGPVPIASAGKPQATIVIGDAAGDLNKYGASELQKYVRLLTGAELPIITSAGLESLPPKESLVLVGSPAANSAVREAVQAKWVNFSGLKPEGFVIKAGSLKGHPAVVVGGNDDVSGMYAAYDLIEQLGVTFELTADVVPSPRRDLAIPALDLRKEPAFPRRGFLLQDGGYENLTMFSYQDYVKLIDQMAKMKCNYIQFWWFSF